MEPAYDAIGVGYNAGRRPDPRIQQRIQQAIGDCSRVLDVGTGTGNYSPTDRRCVGVDPSSLMLSSRRKMGLLAGVQARAEALPFFSGSFDCALAVLTVHHWSDLASGLEEMSRTSARQVIFLREPFKKPTDFWLLDYFPSIFEVEAERDYPTVDDVGKSLRLVQVEDVPVPSDCVDGFLGCYWNRPEAFLDDAVRNCISIFSFLDAEEVNAGVERLKQDIDTGRWDALHGAFRSQSEFWVGHRLLTAG